MLVKEYRICMPLTVEEDRATVHHQQAQPPGERDGRRGGGAAEPAASRRRPRAGPAHGEEGPPVQFSIHIETKYEDNCGTNNSVFHQGEDRPDVEVEVLDIAYDEIPERQYKISEDLRCFSSVKTGRGPLREDWKQTSEPVMCSYKLVRVQFDVWGLQGRVEQFVHKVIRDVLLVGHRQAFAWVDEWYDMTLEDVRTFENQMLVATNQKFGCRET
ncbi:cytoplasmic phosphatidylinositol transfer protein 1-like isoform X3 [Denticeps clupeoides]|uniref:cytoplasmic phosphatidylinositol transfer protein 1-like isoform X3 n=1 Tax=Denticeps clupeoides TaxID=299321 RepID=UPI0010A444A0|nr:cytoplasmic phosphatidylinositol transfer protein 1-like isoform X3 [Denticeps clupeoides]